MKTLSGIFRALAFVCGRVYASAQQPFTMKVAKINLWMWCGVSATALFALVMDYIVAAHGGGWWNWWYLWNGLVLLLDLAMVRAALIGYFWRQEQDADDAAFVQIIVHSYKAP